MTAKPSETPVIAPDSMLKTTWGALLAILGAVAVTAGGWAMIRSDVSALQKKTDRHEEQLMGLREMLTEVRADVKYLRREKE
jgi:hypothetical protein